MTLYTESQLRSVFDEGIDDINGPVTILGGEYSCSYVLLQADPQVYNMLFKEWLNEHYTTFGETDNLYISNDTYYQQVTEPCGC